MLIADDHPLVRQAIRTELEGRKDIRLIGEAGDGEQAVNLAGQLQPDVVVMDISMPRLNGLEATRRIKQSFPQIRVLVLTVYSDSEHLRGIFEAGASGYLTKSAFGEEVVTAIKSVYAGESVLSSQLLPLFMKNSGTGPGEAPDLDSGERLNPRELAILKLFARGMSNRDIARSMNLSLQTIKGYSVNIFAKMQVSSRTEAVMKALRHSIIDMQDLYQ